MIKVSLAFKMLFILEVVAAKIVRLLETLY